MSVTGADAAQRSNFGWQQDMHESGHSAPAVPQTWRRVSLDFTFSPPRLLHPPTPPVTAFNPLQYTNRRPNPASLASTVSPGYRYKEKHDEYSPIVKDMFARSMHRDARRVPRRLCLCLPLLTGQRLVNTSTPTGA